MILVIVIVAVVIVTAIGNMKMFTKLKNFIKARPFMIVFAGWCLAFVLPLFFKPGDVNREKKDTLSFYEISFLSASALFTGIAFAATYLSLKDQKEHFNKQIDLLDKQIKMDVFSDVSEDLGTEDFKKCRKYINSSSFDNDIKRIKQLTQKAEISLQDFKDICYSDNIEDVDEEEKLHLQNTYNMIIRFCSKMEYLGFIYYHTTTNIIVDYYGRTILNMYGRLRRLIEIAKGDKIEHLFFYFAYLYNYAEQRKESYYDEREKEFQKIKMV